MLLLRNGKPDLQFCRSLESGVITMDNEIIGKINAQYDRMVDDELISDVLLGRETILPQEVKQAIQEAAKTHAKDILDQLRELGVDEDVIQRLHTYDWQQFKADRNFMKTAGE